MTHPLGLLSFVFCWIKFSFFQMFNIVLVTYQGMCFIFQKKNQKLSRLTVFREKNEILRIQNLGQNYTKQTHTHTHTHFIITNQIWTMHIPKSPPFYRGCISIFGHFYGYYGLGVYTYKKNYC